MNKKLFAVLWLFLFLISIDLSFAQKTFDKYHSNSEIQQILKELQQSHPAQIQLHQIAKSPGGETINVVEIGKNLKDVPAIFVGANFEGNIPLASDGALAFAKMLLDSSQYSANVKWYILPLPNPDAAKGYFAKVKYNRVVNDFEINNDVDEAVNEDGFEDLNGDGFITQMRVKDLTGTYIASKTDPRVLVKADTKKGERGEYKLYTEGIDNDRDGDYNEDGEGGINVGISFPHLFPKNNKEAGLWPGQTPEVYGIMKFIYAHPEIAMIYNLGSSNTCVAPPKSGRKGDANLQSIKIPSRYAAMFGADPNKSYTMDEVIELMKQRVPAGVEVTPSMVASNLGLGAAVNPLEDDLKFYTKFSEDYKKYLTDKKISTENLDAEPEKDGSFELWSYYQLGVPTFSMNLFSVPKAKEEKKSENGTVALEDVAKMSNEDFLALGNEKIAAFLKANNAPARFSANNVSEMLKTEKLTTKQLVELLKKSSKTEKEDDSIAKEKSLLAYSDKELNGKGFVEWQKYKHPTLGEVEIGGFVPYMEFTPKSEEVDSLMNIRLPWLLQLSKNLPDIAIADEKVTDLGSGVYRLELFIENKTYLPYPISIGERNEQPAPIVVILDGDVEMLQGIMRTPLGWIGGNQVKKLTWIIKTDKKPMLSVKLESTVFGTKVKQIKIG